MQQPGWWMLLGVAAAMWAVPALIAVPAPVAPKLHVRPSRGAATDLEVKGQIAALAGRAEGYVGYAELKQLPQVQAVVDDDPDMPGVTMHVSGVALDELARALGADAGVDLIDANCTDNYRAYYPRQMIRAHRPILVLRMDGMTPRAWAAKNRQEDPGPYLVLYEHFKPAWKVLSHADKPQLPTNVVEIAFEREDVEFGRIAPRGPAAQDANVRAGYEIARQNCIRCHAQGETGGRKSASTWQDLGRDAHDRPRWFEEVIREPKTVNAKATMPGSPEYDEATLAALTAYFRTFAEGE